MLGISSVVVYAISSRFWWDLISVVGSGGILISMLEPSLHGIILHGQWKNFFFRCQLAAPNLNHRFSLNRFKK